MGEFVKKTNLRPEVQQLALEKWWLEDYIREPPNPFSTRQPSSFGFSARLLYNALLQHSSATHFPNTSLYQYSQQTYSAQHFFPILHHPFQRCSTTIFPTLFYDTLLQLYNISLQHSFHHISKSNFRVIQSPSTRKPASWQAQQATGGVASK